MSSHVRRYENEDDAYDAFRQRLVDAESQGEEAGRLGLAADLCPFYAFENGYDEWHRGRLRTLPELRPVLKLTGD